MSAKQRRKDQDHGMWAFDDDPVAGWAEEVAADGDISLEDLRAHFQTLTDSYKGLLKRFGQVARLSDSYQRSLKELTESLRDQARRDPLTGLANRRDMLEQLDNQVNRAKRYGEPFSVIVADVDHFKDVNDKFGHHAGDIVLTRVADQLRATLRTQDWCGRWGGEEFLICLPHTDLNGASVVAEKLRTNVAAATVNHEGSEIRVTVSLGVAFYRPEDDLDTVVRNADRAMFQAKRKGRNRVDVLE